MKRVELTLPQLQMWLNRKLQWEVGRSFNALLSVASYDGSEWEVVEGFTCSCGGRMFSRFRENGYHVAIEHADFCNLTDPVVPHLYSVFYSSEVNGIWSQWAFEAIVPFNDLHTYVNGDRVKYVTQPLPAIEQETSLIPI